VKLVVLCLIHDSICTVQPKKNGAAEQLQLTAYAPNLGSLSGPHFSARLDSPSVLRSNYLPIRGSFYGYPRIIIRRSPMQPLV
jgi:hypothetical protein